MFIREKKFSINTKNKYKFANQPMNLSKYRSLNRFCINLYNEGLIDKNTLDALLIMLQSKYTKSEINRIIKNTLGKQLDKIAKFNMRHKEFY